MPRLETRTKEFNVCAKQQREKERNYKKKKKKQTLRFFSAQLK